MLLFWYCVGFSIGISIDFNEPCTPLLFFILSSISKEIF